MNYTIRFMTGDRKSGQTQNSLRRPSVHNDLRSRPHYNAYVHRHSIERFWCITVVNNIIVVVSGLAHKSRLLCWIIVIVTHYLFYNGTYTYILTTNIWDVVFPISKRLINRFSLCIMDLIITLTHGIRAFSTKSFTLTVRRRRFFYQMHATFCNTIV